MDAVEKLALIDTTLERTAEQLGDITGPVLARYYQRCPEVKALFAELGRGNSAEIEGQMVESILYCFMVWFKSPGEIRILLSESVIHHLLTLGVTLEGFTHLLVSAWEVIAASIPAENSAELAVWSELRAGLQAIIDDSFKSLSPAQQERAAAPKFISTEM